MCNNKTNLRLPYLDPIHFRVIHRITIQISHKTQCKFGNFLSIEQPLRLFLKYSSYPVLHLLFLNIPSVSAPTGEVKIDIMLSHKWIVHTLLSHMENMMKSHNMLPQCFLVLLAL